MEILSMEEQLLEVSQAMMSGKQMSEAGGKMEE